MSNTIKGLLFCILLGLLLLPLIQNKFKCITLMPLKGAIIESEKKYINAPDWFSGNYQLQEEKYLNETFGFRTFFIRLNNQIAFSLFNKAKANGVICGKDNYLFEVNYMNAYYGTDFIGIDSITQRIEKLKFIQDTLRKLNKTLVVVFSAGKGSYYPEYFPKEYIRTKGKTNYDYHVKLAKQYGLNYIDFNNYFVENKNKSKYPLYPKYGIHWSTYGASLAADSMIKYIEKVRNISMPHIFWNDVALEDAKGTDYDIGDGLNILTTLKGPKMAYPVIQVQSDSGKMKPSAIVVADSYYWLMFGNTFTKALSHNQFWYYNKQVYSDDNQNELETSQLNLNDEIQKHDVFIIMATEATLPNLGWGFIENTYNLFKGIHNDPLLDADFQRKIVNLRNYINSDKNWMEQIKKKAVSKKISVDSMITIDAIWEIKHEKK